MKNIKIYPDLKYEKKCREQGFGFVVGLDEVGRGPLAGPVLAAAVCVLSLAGVGQITIKDSKKLTANQREQWHKTLTNHPDIKWGIGAVSEKIIDKINILEATKLAMKRALGNLKLEPDYLLLDGNFLLDDLNINQKAVTRGDEKIFSCAAASIIAKVTRDRLMLKYHKKYPQYGFDRHKGYGTRMHFAALKKNGLSEIHRMSFEPCKANYRVKISKV